MRIKKKDAVIPFGETLAFRLGLLTASVAVLIIGLYLVYSFFRTSTTLAIASGLVSACAVFAIGYNLEHMREAKVPKQTMNRMKRR